jgi:hypothetical protein
MATTPTTCGTAMDVPDRVNVFVVDLGSEKADKISDPGLSAGAKDVKQRSVSDSARAHAIIAG